MSAFPCRRPWNPRSGRVPAALRTLASAFQDPRLRVAGAKRQRPRVPQAAPPCSRRVADRTPPPRVGGPARVGVADLPNCCEWG